MLHYVHELKKGSLEKIAGLFVLSALGILFIVFLFMGGRQYIFAGQYQIHTILNEGYGLKAGSPVNLAGVEIGNVKSIRFNDQNKIDLTLNIQKKYKDKIRTDSTATAVSQNLMGNMALSISIGSLSKPIVADGGKIQGINFSGTDRMLSGINPILAKANEAITNIIYITNKLNSPLSKINNILEKLDKVSEEIEEGRGNIGALLKDKNLYSNLTKVAETSQKFLASLEGVATDIQKASKKFPKLVDKTETSMIAIQKSAEKLPYLLEDGQKLISSIYNSNTDFNKLIGNGSEQIMIIKEILKDLKNVSEDLPGIVISTQENVDEITRIIKGAEQNWIVKGLIEKRKKDESVVIDVRDSHYKETDGNKK